MIDIFTHVPKTGGTTLATTLRWVYGPHSCYHLRPYWSDGSLPFAQRESDRRWQRAKLAYGHVPFGIHRHTNRSCRYFTLLRHPLRRYLSRFYHLKMGYPNNYGDLSLEAFCHRDSPWAQHNDLVRYVSGRDPDREPEAALQEAKHLLVNRFEVFGLLERFDESLMLFRNCLGWSRPPLYLSSNKRSSRPKLEDLSKSETALIRNCHQLDLELYQFAQKRFSEALKREFADLPGALRKFNRKNAMAQPLASLSLSLYRAGQSTYHWIAERLREFSVWSRENSLR